MTAKRVKHCPRCGVRYVGERRQTYCSMSCAKRKPGGTLTTTEAKRLRKMLEATERMMEACHE